MYEILSSYHCATGWVTGYSIQHNNIIVGIWWGAFTDGEVWGRVGWGGWWRLGCLERSSSVQATRSTSETPPTHSKALTLPTRMFHCVVPNEDPLQGRVCMVNRHLLTRPKDLNTSSTWLTLYFVKVGLVYKKHSHLKWVLWTFCSVYVLQLPLS